MPSSNSLSTLVGHLSLIHIYEEFYNRTTEQYGVHYIRGRVSKIYQDTVTGEDGQPTTKLRVRGEDTLLGRPVEIEADMVVLATAMVANEDAAQVAQLVGFSYDKDNFYTESHPKQIGRAHV